MVDHTNFLQRFKEDLINCPTNFWESHLLKIGKDGNLAWDPIAPKKLSWLGKVVRWIKGKHRLSTISKKLVVMGVKFQKAFNEAPPSEWRNWQDKTNTYLKLIDSFQGQISKHNHRRCSQINIAKLIKIKKTLNVLLHSAPPIWRPDDDPELKIQRCNDREYFWKNPLSSDEIHFHFDEKLKIPYVNRVIARRFLEYLNPSSNIAHELPLRFRINDDHFVVNKKEWNLKLEGFAKFMARSFEAVRQFKSPSRKDYLISSSTMAAFGLASSIDLGLTSEQGQFEFIPPQILPSNQEGMKDRLMQSSFGNSYTRLAEIAFQYMEHDFCGTDHDDERDSHSTFIVKIKSQGHLTLINFGENPSYEIEDPWETLKSYYEFIIAEYGKEKIAYIEELYNLNFKNMIEDHKHLSPEIVYKINIGMGNLEIQDIQKCSEQIVSIFEDAKNHLVDSNELDRFLINLHPHYPMQLIRSIRRTTVYESENPTLNHLIKWMRPLVKKLKKNSQVGSLSTKEFNILVDLYALTPVEQEKQYTGKKICDPIIGPYTIAGINRFKPWVDQQELLQSFQDFAVNPKNEIFYEKLAHIYSKKHLARRHPQEKYRVGALISGPVTKDGTRQYFKVIRMINNCHGIVVYSLTPACQGTNLPVVQVYRSTSSDKYHFDGAVSFYNDLNPFNSPGYQGARLLDPYEQKFYENFTIPTWVCYAHLAQKKWQQAIKECSQFTQNIYQDIAEDLKRAAGELKKDTQSQIKQWSLNQLIRRDDYFFFKFIEEASKKSKISSIDQLKFVRTLWKFRQPLAKSHVSGLNDKKYASILVKILQQHLCDESRHLIKLINEHILIPELLLAKQDEILKDFNSKHLNQFNELSDQFNKYILNYEKYKDSLHTLMEKWMRNLQELAKTNNEDIASKCPQNLVFAGHSLGGAAAQQFFVHDICLKNRILLPGCFCELRLFDDPAINAEDNEAFITYGNTHADLLRQLDIKISIIRRQEAVDPVPLSGEVHLGSVSTEDEENKVLRWLRFDASVRESLPHALTKIIRDIKIAHLSQFESAKRQQTLRWNIAQELHKNAKDPNSQKKLQKIVNETQGDFKSTWYSPYIQGVFDSTKDSKSWDELNKLWQIEIFNSETAEPFRKFVGILLRSRSIFSGNSEQIKEDVLHGKWRTLLDKNGAFVVNLE